MVGGRAGSAVTPNIPVPPRTHTAPAIAPRVPAVYLTSPHVPGGPVVTPRVLKGHNTSSPVFGDRAVATRREGDRGITPWGYIRDMLAMEKDGEVFTFDNFCPSVKDFVANELGISCEEELRTLLILT